MPGYKNRSARRLAEETGRTIEEVMAAHYIEVPNKYREETTLKSIVQFLHYETPPIPARHLIRGSHLPVEEQVWYRDTTYEAWDWNIEVKEGPLWYANPAKGQMEWYEAEIDRLHNGVWVMINGKPTYFNNYCYFFHQWFKLAKDIYPIYKDTSLEYFIFYKLCEDDDFTLGDCGIKGRRVGLSSMSASIMLLIGLLESNTNQGVVSKTGDDAKAMYLMVSNALEKLPSFLIPDLAVVAQTELHIAKPKARISANNRTINADKGKNNRVGWLATSENAYDSREMRKIIIDEAAKWERGAGNVNICLSKISETLVQGSYVGGTVSVFSSVNRGDQGGDNFKAIWLNSNQTGKLDSIGQTPSRLKRFFLEGYRGYMGYIDKYGNSVVENPTPEQSEYLAVQVHPVTKKKLCPNPFIGAKDYIQERRTILAGDPEKLAEWIRMYPFKWVEVFRDANNQCCFDLEEVNNQIERIEALLEGTDLSENGRRGVFKKRDNGEVYFEDNSKGMWHILELLAEGNNKSVYKGSIKCPDNTGWGASGLDTYANAKQTVEKGSDACCVIHKRYSALDPENSNYPCAMFIGRPPTKQEFHDQIFYALEYYGIKMLGERSPVDWIDYAVNPLRALASPEAADRLHGYLTTTKRANNSEVYGCAPQDKEQREQHLTEMKEYALNNIKKIKFLRILRDMVGFNIEDRTVFDACMGFGYALMAARSTQDKPKSEPKIINFMQIKRSRDYRYGG